MKHLRLCFLLVALLPTLSSCETFAALPFKSFSTWKSDEDKVKLHFHSNPKSGSGEILIDDEYAPFIFCVNRSNNTINCTLTLPDSRMSFIINASPRLTLFQYGFVNTNNVTISIINQEKALESTDYISYSSELYKSDFNQNVLDAKYCLNQQFNNDVYGISFIYDFNARNLFKMYQKDNENIVFSFLENDRFSITNGENESSGSYRTTELAMFLTFEKDQIYNFSNSFEVPFLIK